MDAAAVAGVLDFVVVVKYLGEISWVSSLLLSRTF